jgi:hypothetical protein
MWLLYMTSPVWWVYLVVAAVFSLTLGVLGRRLWRQWAAVRAVEV